MKFSTAFFVFGAGLIYLGASGCGFVSKGLTSDAELIQRAALSTHVDQSDLMVVPGSVTAHMDSVQFQVKDTEGSVYSCQFSTTMVSTSATTCQTIYTPPLQPAKKRTTRRRAKGTASPTSPASPTPTSPETDTGADDFELEGAGHS